MSSTTALLGRNESGKTNLLRALASLKPPEGIAELSKIKDFPRNRRLSECSPDTPVVETSWELTEQERNTLQGLWPRARTSEPVRVGRKYTKERWVSIPANKIGFDPKHISSVAKKTSMAAKAVADKLDEGSKSDLVAAADDFVKQSAPGDDANAWASAMKGAAEALGIALSKADTELLEKQDEAFSSLTDIAEEILNDKTAQQSAQDWVDNNLPTFVYLADYPEIEGHQDISAYLQRKQQEKQTDADINFEKMCRVADLDPGRLQELGSNIEERNQLANRASAVISGELQRLWADRKLKIRFNPDGNHLETMVSEVTDYYEVEVNLDERSRGCNCSPPIQAPKTPQQFQSQLLCQDASFTFGYDDLRRQILILSLRL